MMTGSVGTAADQGRHDRSTDSPQALDADHSQRGINYSTMIDVHSVVADPIVYRIDMVSHYKPVLLISMYQDSTECHACCKLTVLVFQAISA
jgi:hypothetical protein